MTTPTPEGEWVLTDATLSVVGSDLMLGFDTHEQAVAAMDWLETAAPRPSEQGEGAGLIAEAVKALAILRMRLLDQPYEAWSAASVESGGLIERLATALQSCSAELVEAKAGNGQFRTQLDDIEHEYEAAAASLAQERRRVEANGRHARSDGARTFDDCIAALGYLDNLYRAVLAQQEPEGEK